MATAEFIAKGGDRTKTPELHWLNIDVQAVRPDGSWDIASETACTINMSGPDGKAARFFVTVGIDMNGKPWATIKGMRPNSESKGKCVASWLDFKARAEARIGGGA